MEQRNYQRKSSPQKLLPKKWFPQELLPKKWFPQKLLPKKLFPKRKCFPRQKKQTAFSYCQYREHRECRFQVLYFHQVRLQHFRFSRILEQNRKKW